MSSTQTFKYVIAEDEHLIRKNIIKKIESLALPLVFAGEASNGADAVSLIEENLPDLVITDIQMPRMSGLELAEYISRNHPGTKVVILSGYNDFTFAQTAIKYGVQDYLLKPVTTKSLNASLHSVLIGIMSEGSSIPSPKADEYALTPKDLTDLMIRYMKEHYSRNVSLGDLAERFGFSVEYLGRIFKKHTGSTPSKYLIRLRMNKAKHLLLSRPDLEINKVGQLVGYQDAFYFSRAFKSHTGFQPSEYRERHKELSM